MNESRKTGLLRLRHLQEVNEAKAEEMAEERRRFERLENSASAPRVVSAFNLFQTPEALAARMAGLFPAFGRTLEPSAGLGRLYRAVRALDRSCSVVLVDSSPECCGELYRAIEGDESARLVSGDFLAMDAGRLGGLFDSIIMNPPFKNGTDLKHVRHAYGLLAPGGRLVAIMSEGAFCRERDHAFREWLESVGGTAERLAAGTFKEAYTNVGARLVVIDRK